MSQISKHILFWVVSFIILVAGFGHTYGNYANSIYFVAFLLPVAMATSYLFNYYLVPIYLMKSDYIRFYLYTFYTVIASLFLQMIVITLSFIIIVNYNFGELDPIMTNIFVLGFSIYLIVLLKAFYLLYRRVLHDEFRMKQLESEKESLKTDFITVKSDRANQQIKLKDILYIESLSDYVNIHTSKKSVATRATISSFEKSLPETFLRIHRSFIVNREHILSFNSSAVRIDGNELPVSRTYKSAVLKTLSDLN
jgi:two-component system, LytTR family, response regulator LytT